jgi:hypothetical protein
VSSPSTAIAVFNPEAGGKPARISMFSYAHTDVRTDAHTDIVAAASSASPQSQAEVQGPLNSRTVFSASEAR